MNAMRCPLLLLVLPLAVGAHGQCAGTVSPSGTAICEGQTLTLTLSEAGPEVDSLQWQEGAPGNWTDLGDETDATVQVSPAVDTWYRCLLFCGADTVPADSVEVTVVAPIAVTITGPEEPFCEVANATLTASGADTYVWEPDDSLDPDTGAEVVSTATAATTYTVTGTTGPCTATSTFTVAVNQPPGQPTITPQGPTQLCTGDEVTLTTDAGNPHWSTGEETSSIIVNSEGTYWVMDSVPGCPADTSDTVEVTVTDIVPVTCPPDTALCSSGTPYTLAGTGEDPVGGTFLFNGNAITAFDPASVGPGAYDIGYVYNSCSNCSFTITVETAPDAGTDAEVTICSNATPVDLDALLGPHDADGAWTAPDGAAADNLFNPSVDMPGTYEYTVQPGSTACEADAASVTVDLATVPDLALSAVDLQSVCNGQWMDINVSGTDPAFQYEWACDSCTFEPIPSSTDTMVTVQWHNLGTSNTATGTLTVTASANNCTISITEAIIISNSPASCPKGIVFFEPHGLAILDPTAQRFQWGTIQGNAFTPIDGATDQSLFDPGLIHDCDGNAYVARTSIDGQCWSTTARCADPLMLARECPDTGGGMAPEPELRADPNPWTGGPLWLSPFNTGSDEPVRVEILDPQGRTHFATTVPATGADLGSVLEGHLPRGPLVLRATPNGRPMTIKLIVQ